MDRQMLNDQHWLRIAPLLPGKPTDKGERAADKRRFVEGVLFIARTACPWRDLPQRFWIWHSVYVRFARWEVGGVWSRVAEARRGRRIWMSYSSTQRLFVPTSIRRELKKNGDDQAMARSPGGLSTQIHACVDAVGNPTRLVLTGGQAADVTQGAALVAGLQSAVVTADKGYDGDERVEQIESTGACASIKPRSHRKNNRPADWYS